MGPVEMRMHGMVIRLGFAGAGEGLGIITLTGVDTKVVSRSSKGSKHTSRTLAYCTYPPVAKPLSAVSFKTVATFVVS